MDVAVMWQQRRLATLLRLIDQLPRNSRYVEALTDDDDLAPHLLASPSDGPAVRMSDWSEEVSLLAALVDRVGALTRVLVGLNGGKPPEVASYPRPVTAVDRLRDEQGRQKHLWLVEQLLGHDETA